MSDFFFFLSSLFSFFLDETKRSKIISIPLRLRGGCNNNETSRTIRGGEQGVHIVITSARSRITSYRDFADRAWNKVESIDDKVEGAL